MVVIDVFLSGDQVITAEIASAILRIPHRRPVLFDPASVLVSSWVKRTAGT